MQSYSPNQRVSIDLNADLVDWVDELIGDADSGSDTDLLQLEQQRIQAIEEAIQLWCQQKSKHRLQNRADQHRQRHDNDETGWLV
ncbi:hypothetical protein C7B61_15685 [filamentous cyanobacterium CCP1]|nr:hypothetical protein C7B76_26975 [filamentous cyanobacterium CCP2]PSB61622.1 hypothetical protein C7B61_15685 [filamentous cyanobacterium CCP1]